MKRLLKNIPLLISCVLICTIVASGLTGCITKTVTVSPGTTNAGTVALTVVKGTQTKTLTMADIEALPAISDSTGDITSAGTIEGPFQYKGVAVSDILNAVGGITADEAVRITAKDNYTMTFSYAQIANGGEFITYDSTTGKEVAPSGKVTVFLAYEKDGKAIDDSIGPLRTIIMAPGQLTDGHWNVKWTTKIEVISVQKAWNLTLQGAINQDMDKATFESGVAPGCHGINWTDAQGHIWTGMPLWYLIGWVDNSTTMDYSDALADQGYEIHVANSNGDIAMYTSQFVKRNDNLIIAYQVDGQPLSGAQWPLALVGSAVDQQHQISGIVKIRLIFPSTTSTTP
jgi:hypothetical protein